MLDTEIKDILRIARTKDDITNILLNLEDFYDLIDSNDFKNRIDIVKVKALQEQGLYAHIDGFSIYCSKNISMGKFALGAKSDNLSVVPKTAEIKWSEYAPYYSKNQLPKIGQRYSDKAISELVIEIVDITYENNKYAYMFKVKVVQTHATSCSYNISDTYLCNIGDTYNLSSLENYTYLSGQHNPIC
jgi:hypothetical protein